MFSDEEVNSLNCQAIALIHMSVCRVVENVILNSADNVVESEYHFVL